MVNSLVYYGISLNTGVLAGDPYLNATYSALVELLAIVTCHFAIGRFGRKYPYSLNMLLAGVSLIVIQFVPTCKLSKSTWMISTHVKYSKFYVLNSFADTGHSAGPRQQVRHFVHLQRHLHSNG